MNESFVDQITILKLTSLAIKVTSSLFIILNRRKSITDPIWGFSPQSVSFFQTGRKSAVQSKFLQFTCAENKVRMSELLL